jgi:HSP20 family protein
MPSRAARKRRAQGAEKGGLDSVERLVRLRQEAERIVAELFRHAPGSDEAAGPRVPIDLYEGPDDFLLSIELPGVDRQDVALSVIGTTLVVEGRKRASSAGERVAFECAERGYGPFRRVLELPGAADTGRGEARLERGILYVTLPRIRERRGRRRGVPIG